MRNRTDDAINIAIMENEINAHDWVLNKLASELYWWTDFFNIAFFKNQPVPVPVISFKKTRVNNLGHYVIGRNAFGIRENININQIHLNRPLADVLSTLLHEMTHSWQATFGKPAKGWFHNLEFVHKLNGFGIICNNSGSHLDIGDPFLFLLQKHGIPFGDGPGAKGMISPPTVLKPKGDSKLKKWQCSCGQNARVGKKAFHATCDLCGEPFESAM